MEVLENKSLLGEREETAAQMLARSDLTQEEIIAETGIPSTTYYRLKKNPAFIARVRDLQDEMRVGVRGRGIGSVENRVLALQDRWRRMKRIIEERAADPKMQNIPGGKTGLLVHNVKGVGDCIIDLYEVDTGLLSAMCQHEKQAAQELGQWEDKHAHSGPGGGAIPISVSFDVSKLNTDELRNLRDLRAKMATSEN